MFDSLKEKLNKFSDDVDEETEERETEPDDEKEDEQRSERQTDGVGVGEQVKATVSGKKVITESELEQPLRDLEMYLLEHDVEMSVVDDITEGVRERLVGEKRSQLTGTDEVVREAVKESILDVLQQSEFDFDAHIEDSEKPVVIIFTGVNGVGKTTTIAKVAKHLRDNGHSTVMANGDTFRAGAGQQFQQHADALDVRAVNHEGGSDPTAVIYDAVEYAKANDVDVVLGDTAGRLHTSDDLMSELEKINRVIDPDITFFVDEAIAGQDAIHRAEEFNDAVDIDGTILTKADADAEGGAAISIARITGEPIVFIGNGQGYDDIVKFHPDLFVDALF